jgi:hypothetical protein
MFYKTLYENGDCFFGGRGPWSLPTKRPDGSWKPGTWRRVKGPLVMCHNGLHFCINEGQLIKYLGPALFEGQCRGRRQYSDNKIVVREARLVRRIETWNEQTARLVACDYVARVLPYFEHFCPEDRRPRYAIEMARAYANGKVSNIDLVYAASLAADAAENAKGNIAFAVANSASTAASDNARDNLREIAEATERISARMMTPGDGSRTDAQQGFISAERTWHARRLRKYLLGETE